MDYPAEISNDRAGRVLTIVWQDGVRQQLSLIHISEPTRPY